MKRSEEFFIKTLKNAGWYEGRKLEYEYVCEMVKREGYPILPNVINFLQEFMNIKILFENKRNGLKKDDLNFSFEEATDIEVPERINEEYVQRIGKELCPIGTVYRKYMVLVMANDMCVYAGFDSYLCKVADSGIDAIRAIIFGDDFVPIE